MTNLQEMTLKQAIRMAKETSGKTGKEIADSLGISRSVMKRYLNEEDDYSPRMGIIPDLCKALENDILLQWLEVRIRGARQSRKEKMLLYVAKMEKALRGVALLISTGEEMSARREEELYELVAKIEWECQRMLFLFPRTRRHPLNGKKRPAKAQGPGRHHCSK